MKQMLYRNRDWLCQKYWENNLSVAEIAKLCGCRRNRIRLWMKKFGIKRRNLKEAQRLRYSKKKANLSYRDQTWLNRMYWKQHVSISLIAKICEVDRKTIKYWMDKHGIRRRDHNEAQELWLKQKYGSLWKRFALALKGSHVCFKKYFLL